MARLAAISLGVLLVKPGGGILKGTLLSMGIVLGYFDGKRGGVQMPGGPGGGVIPEGDGGLDLLTVESGQV